jgi:hypothetical protein
MSAVDFCADQDVYAYGHGVDDGMDIKGMVDVGGHTTSQSLKTTSQHTQLLIINNFLAQ